MAAKCKARERDAERAVALDERDSFNHFALGRVCMISGDRDRSIAAFEKSIDLNPSSAQAYHGLGFALIWFGRAKEAVPMYSRAIRLSPHDPQLWSFYQMRGLAHSMQDDFEPAITDLKTAIHMNSDEFWPRLHLAYVYGCSGNHEEARQSYSGAVKLKTELSSTHIKSFIGTLHPPYLEKYLGSLRKVGLPEN